MPSESWFCILLASLILIGCPRERTERVPARDPAPRAKLPPISPASMALMRDGPRRTPANARSPIGTNLGAPDYVSRDW
ncbi:MAG: hypothetical protein AAFN74_09850, partial [Myxococcota bacterium]